jgi:hypothetical protein
MNRIIVHLATLFQLSLHVHVRFSGAGAFFFFPLFLMDRVYLSACLGTSLGGGADNAITENALKL